MIREVMKVTKSEMLVMATRAQCGTAISVAEPLTVLAKSKYMAVY